ncbi:PKD domain-containing protein, partial [Candidatus Bathyarchaeota archaeon]|nr:PKD domain-containing protein [Candidatus Bathyarchaeota archaeon]
WTNQTMNLKASLYVAEIPVQPYNVNVSYKVYAYDGAASSAVSDTYSYVVIDSYPPVISWVERSPISPNHNDTVSVTASVTEPKEASGVQLVILSYSDGVAWTNTTMTLKAETIYAGSIPTLPYGTTVEYLVYALDNAENWGFSSTYCYTVGAPAPVHDIAIVDVFPSPSIVKVGGTVAINVTVLNAGTITETFNVSVYYNVALLETRTLVLNAGARTTPTFTWVTTSEGVYLIWAEVEQLPEEANATNNVFVDGTVTVSSLQPPVASFTFSPMSPYTGQDVTFDASLSYDLDGTIDSYTWSFGDGAIGDGKIVTHSYADNGTYEVELTVVDSDGLTDIESDSITVLNRPPVASFTESAETAYVGDAITFNASESHDPDGYIVSYFWNFGDGAKATGVTVDHAYDDDGSYAVTLTVTDDDGATASAVALKIISNRSPTAAFTYKAKTAYSGEAIRFDASASFDPDGYITSYFWTFGDGTNATDIIVTHVYADDGSYMVTLTVTDDDGANASSTAAKTVLNRPPVASFTESATTVFAGEVIQFNASASYDPDGSIVSYTWNFGDDNITTSFTTTINHTYTTPGTYNVTLTVTDDDGLTDDKVKTLTVETAPWPLSLIVVIILLIVAATAIYLVRKWRRKIKASIAVE